MQLQLDEVRRLTGPNLLSEYPGAIVDVFIEGVDKQVVIDVWERWAKQLISEFGWQEKCASRVHEHGANLAISAPLDALYTACDLAELAWECCVAELLVTAMPDYKVKLSQLHGDLDEEINPALLQIIAMAQERQVTWLVDDDELSLGMGSTAKTWPVDNLPSLSSIVWSEFHDVPCALVTGTNGKSTSVRLAAEIAKAAGFVSGVTSTDFIRVGEDIIDRGDYSGPGGARMLLRDKRTQIAFLEVARGGILRRGLPIQRVDAALITNVASDHLGQYGINTVSELTEAKFVVTKALNEHGVLIANADDNQSVQQIHNIQQAGMRYRLCWFSLDETNELIQEQFRTGGRAVFVRSNKVIYHTDGLFEELCTLSEIPMTFNGSARHNVQNALGVVGLCHALKLPLPSIRQGLQRFASNTDDNPGRGNCYTIGKREVIVDFAHNEHSMRAVVDMVKRMPAKRCIVMFGHAGDRSDKDIKDLTNAVFELDASYYIISELENYLRGRELGELPMLAENTLSGRGVPEASITVAPTPLNGAKKALALSEEGDVVLLFVLDQRDQIHEWLLSQKESV